MLPSPPMRGAAVRFALVGLLALAMAAPRTAHAYEFWLRARTIGQAYQLREYQLVGPDLFHGRRRYSQLLALRITDIGNLSAQRRQQRVTDRGLTVSWQSYLRIDHDFGSFSSGRIRLSERTRRDALDVIPELAETVANLDLLYGYLEFAGFARDRATVKLGRVLADEGWGTAAVDGVLARIELPAPIAVTASAGLRVRASSLLGLSAYELDGTSGAGCREYVAGTTPGTGSFLLIDRDRAVRNTRLASDYETCPQRDALQPTVGVAVATSRMRRVGAELGYRRTWSRTAEGLYADDVGQAPTRGVNEERLHARLHAVAWVGAADAPTAVALRPYVNARYSLLHGVLDRADAGVRIEHGAHALEPAVEYFFPTFDGDSIFNVFSIDPTADVRLGYRHAGTVQAAVNAWLRRYAPGEGQADHAGGGDASLARALGHDWRARVEALYDAGYGGRRVGGAVEAGWRAKSNLWLRGRVFVLGIDPDTDDARYVSTSGVVSTTWRVADAVTLHGITEVDQDPRYGVQTRAIAILDFAFQPEQ